jgi:hypothetical protein
MKRLWEEERRIRIEEDCIYDIEVGGSSEYTPLKGFEMLETSSSLSIDSCDGSKILKRAFPR